LQPTARWPRGRNSLWSSICDRHKGFTSTHQESTGYKPIALSVDGQPGLVLRDAQYPRSEDYHFKPLNEHVQVYQQPFRIVQDILIEPSPQGQTALNGVSALTIKGVLTYQACNDKVCFTPQTVPLTWTVNLRQLDRERAKP